MKPAPFELKTPSTLAEALAALATAGEDGRALAGGQSLIPLLNFRLSQPEVLVDLGDVSELRYVAVGADGWARIGAMTTLTGVLRSGLLHDRHSVLTEAIKLVAHAPIRNRGTIGGSLAHADPSAELPAIMLLMKGVLIATSASGSRDIPAEEFFVGPYSTALREGELLTEVRIPPTPEETGSAVLEVASRTGDFALAGAACLVQLDDAGCVQSLRVVVFAASTSPVVLTEVDSTFVGQVFDDALVLAVARRYSEDVVAVADLHGSSAFRRHLVRIMVSRVLHQARKDIRP